MTKIKQLVFVFVGLVVLSVVLSWLGKKEKKATFDKSLFAIADTTQMTELKIESASNAISIKRQDGKWSLNDQFDVDPQLVYLSQRILNAVQAQRPVSMSNFEAIKNDLEKSGKRVVVSFKENDPLIFHAGGNASKTIAYFGNQELTEIYTVAIPAYKSYLSGIFELTVNQWRDRILFASSWRTLQQLTIDYTDVNRKNLSISFEGKFLAVDGVNQMDTAFLMNYMQTLESFQVNDYLDKGSFSRYDSLLGVEPLAALELKDIDATKNKSLSIYPKITGERFYLLTDETKQMIVIDEKRMGSLLASPSIFKSK